MGVGDILSGIGRGVEAVGKAAVPVLERTAQVVSGEAPQIDAEQRQHQQKLEDAAIESKANELQSQLAMGQKYGTLTPEDSQKYVDAITNLYSHPRHAGTLMEKLRQAIHPQGAVATPGALSTLKNAMPEGGTASADEANAEKLAAARQASKPLPKDAAFLESYAKSIGKKSWSDLTPDEMVEAFNKEGETKAAQDKETHQKALDDYRTANIKLRQSTENLHEAQFRASQDPNNPKFKMELEKARTSAMRDEAYMINAQARAFGEVNGKALPGAALTAEGQPVGSAFAANVKPTGVEVGRADLATSALEQMQTMHDILSKRGDMFGPGAGRATQMEQWIGSQDPDAQRFTAAATTAADHLMGVFGGRSTWAGQRIEAAMGQLKTNPEAAMAALDQMSKAAKTIQARGTRQVVGGVPGTAPLKTITNPPGGAQGVKPVRPAGAVGTVTFEGKKYWVDKDKNNLGEAK
jgi:ABC-type transporter MlaC component